MSGSDVSIRAASADDAATIARLYCEGAAEAVEREPVYFHVPDAVAVRRRYEDRLSEAGRRELVAEDVGEVVAFVDAGLRTPGEDRMLAPRTAAYVEELFVRSDHRGHGLGRSLIEEVETWCRSQGGNLVLLDTGVRNEGARRFYERLGFREIGVVLMKEWP